jgi:hypothetical protein
LISKITNKLKLKMITFLIKKITKQIKTQIINKSSLTKNKIKRIINNTINQLFFQHFKSELLT